jgi:hypothetical protein
MGEGKNPSESGTKKEELGISRMRYLVTCFNEHANIAVWMIHLSSIT